MLTTMTTVLGLTPLLFERSQQAQFLKPTVITLVYGLGFGMVMVLLLVPALLAVQHDFSRQITAFRRSLSFRAKGVQRSLALGMVAMVGWFAATLGTVLVKGTLPGAIESIAPAWATAAPVSGAFMLFLLGTVAIAVVIYLGVAGARIVRSKKVQPAGQP